MFQNTIIPIIIAIVITMLSTSIGLLLLDRQELLKSIDKLQNDVKEVALKPTHSSSVTTNTSIDKVKGSMFDQNQQNEPSLKLKEIKEKPLKR